MLLNKNSNTLDIVIPVYGRIESFSKLLEGIQSSILDNDLSQVVSIIVVDDASIAPVDISLEHIQVSLIRNDVNSGAPISRKTGFNSSTARFVHFHDSDDAMSETWLIDVISALEKEPEIDLLVTARVDVDKTNSANKLQKYFHQNIESINKVKKRLIYRNCMGPLGGVTFSRRVLEDLEFKRFASCQDWQMYLQAIKRANILKSLPDTRFIFNKTGDDRISHNPRKKILGHLQLARITAKKSIFKRNIRLFYLYTCKDHIYNKGGSILKLYKKNRFKVVVIFLVVSIYWRIT